MLQLGGNEALLEAANADYINCPILKKGRREEKKDRPTHTKEEGFIFAEEEEEEVGGLF